MKSRLAYVVVNQVKNYQIGFLKSANTLHIVYPTRLTQTHSLLPQASGFLVPQFITFVFAIICIMFKLFE